MMEKITSTIKLTKEEGKEYEMWKRSEKNIVGDTKSSESRTNISEAGLMPAH